MATTIRFERDSIVVSLAPGQTLVDELTLEALVDGGEVRVGIVGADGAARIESLDQYHVRMVPCDDDDVRNADRLPPLLRTLARRRTLCERVIRAMSIAGGSSIRIGATDRLVVRIALQAAEASGQARAATVVVESASWGRFEWPIVVTTGSGDLEARADPERVFDAIPPGTTRRYRIVVGEAPSAAAVVATLAPVNPFFRIVSVVASAQVHKFYTEAELATVPEELRADMREKGYYLPVEAARAAGNEPVAVPWPGMLEVEVEVAAPERPAQPWSGATLTINSTGWRKINVPFSLNFAQLAVAWNVPRLEVRQGESSEPFTVALGPNGGPDTDVEFALGADEGRRWHMVPPSTHVRRGAGHEATLRLRADTDAPVGTHALALRASWYEGRASTSAPLQLVVRPGGVRVATFHRSLVLQQGDRAALRLQIQTHGGRKRIVFTPAAGQGVHIERVVWEREGAAHEALDIPLVVDELARPRERERFVLRWDAGDGEHAQAVEFELTVHLRPQQRHFEQGVVTPDGSTLGGRVEIDVSNDGRGRFKGRMFTSGVPSYAFRVRAVVRGPDGRLGLAMQKTGQVHGSIDPAGSSRFEWDDPIASWTIRDNWPHLRGGSLAVSKSYEISGPIADLADAFLDVMEFVLSSAVLGPVVPGGPALAGLVFVGSELEAFTGLRVVGPGGLVGLAAAGAGLVFLGPGVIIPAFVGGVLATAATMRFRPLEEPERVLARMVFGGSLPFDRIIITNMTGIAGRPFVVPNEDQQIIVNLGDNFHDVQRPAPGNPKINQLFFHELTHAWQIANDLRPSGFVAAGIVEQVLADEPYLYGPAGTAWSDFSLEAQASVVAEWAAGDDTKAIVKMPGRIGMREDDPYFRYIVENIQAHQP